MQTEILLRKALSQPRHRISREQFNDWKRDPVTEQLFFDLSRAIIEEYWDDLPTDSIERSSIVAHQREGAKKLVDSILDWQPDYQTEENDND